MERGHVVCLVGCVTAAGGLESMHVNNAICKKNRTTTKCNYNLHCGSLVIYVNCGQTLWPRGNWLIPFEVIGQIMAANAPLKSHGDPISRAFHSEYQIQMTEWHSGSPMSFFCIHFTQYAMEWCHRGLRIDERRDSAFFLDGATDNMHRVSCLAYGSKWNQVLRLFDDRNLPSSSEWTINQNPMHLRIIKYFHTRVEMQALFANNDVWPPPGVENVKAALWG